MSPCDEFADFVLKIQVFNPKIDQLIAPDCKIEQVAAGFQFVEGLIWHPGNQTLIFSDILGNSLYRWSKKSGVETLRRNSYMANGNTYDRQGRVITCEHATSRVTRTDFAGGGELEVLATHYQTQQLNSPNDMICKSDGAIYFTDPAAGRTPGFGSLYVTATTSVYRLSTRQPGHPTFTTA